MRASGPPTKCPSHVTDTHHEVFRMRVSHMSKESVRAADHYLSTTLITNLSQDRKLLEFYDKYLHLGEPIPAGGYAELKMGLVRWLTVRQLDSEYGFGKKSKVDKEASGVPAITAFQIRVRVAPTNDQRDGSLSVNGVCVQVMKLVNAALGRS